MKKLLLLTLTFFLMVPVLAQNSDRNNGTTNKHGYQILPKAGDFALVLDGVDIAKMLINTSTPGKDKFHNLNNSGGSIFNETAITGRYFLENNKALRLKLHIGFGSESYKNEVVNDALVATNPDAKVEDKLSYGKNGLGLRGGMEWRRGYGRLQAFYGAELGLGFWKNNETYTYGNPMTLSGATTTTNFNTIPNTGVTVMNRIVEAKGQTNFSALLGGFVGVEYFFARKAAIGGEVNLGVNMSSFGKRSISTERIDAGAVVTETNESYLGMSNQFNFGTTISTALYVAFYF